VALAAIQGLNQKLEASQRENSALQERVEKLEKILQKLVNE
jgi:polyhydroxyalkanoate synthesis regulator phasin